MARGAPPEQWKEKYFQALEELEEKEKRWQNADEVFRRGMGRLALISQGVDPILDRRLNNLRKMLLKNESVGRIDELVEEVSARVKVLDELSEGRDALKPQALLARVLDTVPFPKPLQRSARKLKKRLNAADAETHLNEIVTELSALVGEALKSQAEQDAGGEGLFSRLLGKGRGQEAPAATSAEAGRPDAVSPASMSPEPRLTGDDGGDEVTDGLRLLEGVFVDFFEQLTFPTEFSERVQALKAQLEAGIEIDQVQPFTQGLVTLIIDMRKGLESEKAELEAFLQQLTQRLHDLDGMIEGAESHRKASLESGRRLDAMVNAQVSDIEMVVNSATEVAQMKVKIQSSLESIRTHLAEQRGQEESRHEELERQLKQMTERLKQMEEESSHLKKRLEIERANALTDPLTGAPNRLAYDQRISQEFARWRRHQYPLSLVVMDIDHFKRINDTFGHKAGDRALKAIVQALRQHVRASDFMARIGGEEFVLLLPETDLDGAYRAAEKLRKGIESCEFAYKGEPVPITISGGIAQFAEGDTPDSVYVRADEALYRAKHNGRNQFQKEKK